MARSLTVRHEETPSISPLFTVFLLIAFGWMMLAALTGWAGEHQEALELEQTELYRP